jgi:hypothetical protein
MVELVNTASYNGTPVHVVRIELGTLTASRGLKIAPCVRTSSFSRHRVGESRQMTTGDPCEFKLFGRSAQWIRHTSAFEILRV